MNIKKKRRFILPLMLSVASLVSLVSCSNASTMPKVLGETLIGTKRLNSPGNGNYYIQKLMVYEKSTHVPYLIIPSNNSATTETSNRWFTTGITIYAQNNTGITYSSSEIKASSNTFFIDFTNGECYYPSDVSNNTAIDTLYKFGIYNSSGTCVFYEKMTSTDPISSDSVTQTYYGYGVSTKNVTLNDGAEGKAKVALSNFGKRNLTLSDGTYTIKIEREYTWLKTTSSSTGVWKSSSTSEISLVVDGTLPTISMKDSNGNSISNGGYANKNVTVTATDDHLSGMYVKTPGSSSYSYKSGSYTTNTGDGWYYFYANDTLSNESEVYSFYLDTSKPTGSIKSNGNSVSNRSYISNSFAYTASDSGSGISKIYYKSPVSGSYIEYSSGSIIPSTSGDGWYEFY